MVRRYKKKKELESDIEYLEKRILGIKCLIAKHNKSIAKMESEADISKIGVMLVDKAKNYAIVTDYYSFSKEVERIFKLRSNIEFEKRYVSNLTCQLKRVEAMKMKKEANLKSLTASNIKPSAETVKKDKSKTPNTK